MRQNTEIINHIFERNDTRLPVNEFLFSQKPFLFNSLVRLCVKMAPKRKITEE